MGDLWLPVDLRVGHVAFSAYVNGIFATQVSFERSAGDQLAPPPGKLRLLTFLISSMNPHRLACMFSALPYARSLQSLHLIENQFQVQWVLSKLECWWMAYACFHPRTTTSSWHGLDLQDGKFGDDAREAFREIQQHPVKALSITRLAVLGGIVTSADADSDRLQIATVKSGAAIYTKSNTQADALIVLESETELEMCDVHSDGWYCVLVPGYGFDWVQQTEVVDTREWTPELSVTSSLKHLTLIGYFTLEDTLLLLSGIGNSIQPLTLGKSNTSASSLDDLMLRYPNLESLTIGGQKDRLSQDSLERLFSQKTNSFEPLTVDFDKANLLVLLDILTNWTDKDAVKRFKRLSLQNITYHKFTQTQMDSFETMLRANKSLEQRASPSLSRVTAGTSGRQAQVSSHHGEDIHRTQRLRQRWAFLGVVKYQSERRHQSALGLLDSAVIAMILKFSALPVRRIVYLAPTPMIEDDEDDLEI